MLRDVSSGENLLATSRIAVSPEMTALIAAKDWSATPLGPPEAWPMALRMMLDIALATPFQVVFWWGPQLLQFYNDAYRPTLGDKHPHALGQPAQECWPEIWDVVGPLMTAAYTEGASTWQEDLPLALQRHGFIEETYHTFSYSPVPDHNAPSGIGGVLCNVQETTEKVIGAHRLRVLRELAERASHASSVEDECLLAAATLGLHATSVPFALIYLLDESKTTARLAASAGVAAGSDAAPETIDLLGAAGPWPLRQVFETDESLTIDSLAAVLSDVPPGPWPEPPRSAIVLPIASSVAGDHLGFLVAGISSRQQFDDGYRAFYGLVARQIAAAIVGARAYEDERKRAEALAEIDRAKTAFFSNVSHEFRTPLTLMLGPLEELARSADAESSPLLESAHRNALRLLKLVNTLLEFSRIEAGRTDAVFVPTNLGAATRDLCSVFESAIESVGLDFIVDVDELAEPVYVDRAMWEKIVLNLLSNALKFTLEGGIRVTLAAEGRHAALHVDDTGVGIPQDELPHLFERFRRVRGAKSRSHEGSGIGLALVDELVRLHGGTLEAESQIGDGTRFTVRLPFDKAHLDPRAVVEASAAGSHISAIEQYLADIRSTVTNADAPPLRPATLGEALPRILIADDNGDLRAHLTRLLSRRHNVIAVTNGREALDAARETPFDLIVSDVMMPEMDGFELLAEVRKDPAIAQTPFIMLSARAGEDSAIEGLHRGADDYLAKPFSSEELLARVHAHLNAAKIREEALAGLRSREKRFRALAETLPALVHLVRPDGYVYYSNPQWYVYTGQTPDIDVETAWEALYHPDDIRLLTAAWQRSKHSGMPLGIDARLRGADGEYRWHTLRGVATRNTSGEIQYWTVTCTDIHDYQLALDRLRQRETELAESAHHFEALADAVPVIVWTANADGWIDWYNNRWYEYTGLSPQESAGWGWQAAHHPDDLNRVMEVWPQAIESGEPFDIEFRLRRYDGAFHQFLSRVRPLRNESGEVVRWYGSDVDIHVQKVALEQSQRVAETLQGVFLPDALPHTELLRVDAIYAAAEKDALVGGDWFEAVKLPDGRYLLSIGDVTGHGLSASIVAGRLRQAITDFAFISDDPAEILASANRILRFQNPNVFATAAVALIDSACTRVTFASAGHPQLLLATRHGEPATELPYGGLPLGVQDDVRSIARTIDVPRDAVLAMYTDGITEFTRDTEYAEALLKDAVGALVGNTRIARPAIAVQQAVLGDALPVDDVALLIAQFARVDPDVVEDDPTRLQKTWRFHSSDAQTAHASRQELMKFIRQSAPESDELFHAELILGEILANTVEHAPGLVEVDIDWRGPKPVVTVLDSGSGLDELLAELPSDVMNESGRGLFLIKAFADAVSVTPSKGYGTELRVVLPVHRGGSPGE